MLRVWMYTAWADFSEEIPVSSFVEELDAIKEELKGKILKFIILIILKIINMNIINYQIVILLKNFM